MLIILGKMEMTDEVRKQLMEMAGIQVKTMNKLLTFLITILLTDNTLDKVFHFG